MLNVGDIVKVHDGSYSIELVGGKWKHTHPAMPSRSGERWKVLMTGGELPYGSFSEPWDGSKNDVLLVNTKNPENLLCSQERFLHRQDPASPATLEERVSRLETRVRTLSWWQF